MGNKVHILCTIIFSLKTKQVIVYPSVIYIMPTARQLQKTRIAEYCIRKLFGEESVQEFHSSNKSFWKEHCFELFAELKERYPQARFTNINNNHDKCYFYCEYRDLLIKQEELDEMS